jgi:selenide,water dikinase
MRDLVLVGGGHAHVQVLTRLAMEPVPGIRVTLVVDRTDAVYSGMVPGFVAGQYRADELTIDVRPLARRAGAAVVVAAATGFDPTTRRIELAGRPALRYDVASLDVGSTVRGLDLPGVAVHALATRPIGRFVAEIDARLARAGRHERVRIAVVGAGAGGVELAFAVRARLAAAGRHDAQITLVDSGTQVLPGMSARVAARAARRLAARGISLRSGAHVIRIEAEPRRNSDFTEKCLVFGDKTTLASDEILWVSGACAPAWLSGAPLPHDGAGFVRVRPTLQVVGHDDVFAAGDCAAFTPALPKAGVYAVRQGPLLARNLCARLEQLADATPGRRELRLYRPQRDFLALLNLGDGTAIGAKWGVPVEGRALFLLKDWIDRRFMRRFQVLTAGGERTAPFPAMPGMADAPCGGCAAKVGAAPLARALARLGVPHDDTVVLGLAEADDVAAVATTGSAVVVASLDAFRAFTDDPWLVGRIAAVNAAGDLWAKAVTPRFALAQVTVPDSEPERSEETLYQVLAGARAAFDPDGITLVGGHSVAGDALGVGFAVGGTAPDRDALLRQTGLVPGDHLILTKPLGTGLLWRADMLGEARGEWIEAAVTSMCRSHAEASRIARAVAASAGTDVTGFGLAGHLGALLHASGVGAHIDLARLPLLPGARECLARGVRSTFHAENARMRQMLRVTPDAARHPAYDVLFDPQTSGGLLFGVAPARSADALARLHDAGDERAAVIGEVEASVARDGPDAAAAHASPFRVVCS